MTFASQLRAQLPYPLSYFDRQLLVRVTKYIPEFTLNDVRFGQTILMKLLASERDLIREPLMQSHILVCANIHALYLVLRQKNISHEMAMDQLRHAISQPGRRLIGWAVRLSLMLSNNKRQTIVQQVREKAWTVYGDGFDMREQHEPTKFTSLVHRCAYFDYFARHGASDLTQIMCAWDRVWIDVIDHHFPEIEFSRPTKLSTGGCCCRFEFEFKSDTRKVDRRPIRGTEKGTD